MVSSVTIYPQQAADDGCSATIGEGETFVYVPESAPGFYEDHVTTFRCEAIPSSEWEFDHWELTSFEESDIYPSVSREFSGNDNPTETSVDAYASSFTVYESTRNFHVPSEYYWTFEVIGLRAVFKKRKLVVTTSCVPDRAATQTGAGEYEKDASCTIDTDPECSPWIFDHWELTPGGIVNTRQHTFTVNQDTSCVAYYTHPNTGLPYYDADGGGEIVCNPSGNILYDGDLVTV